MAYQKTLTMQKINDTGKLLLTDLTQNPILDHLAVLFNVVRLPAASACCTLKFKLIPGHLQITIPIGTRVRSTDGNTIFETIKDVTVNPDVSNIGGYVNVVANCQTSGIGGNGYQIGNICILQDVYAYITSVSNTDITSGGSDIETDQQLRERIKMATYQFSVAGSRNSYIFWTKSANALITDVSVVTYSEVNKPNYTGNEKKNIPVGEVWIYVLLKDGQVPNSALITEIEVAVSSEKVRPMTEKVVVMAPEVIKYQLYIDVVKYPEYNGADIITQITDILTAFGVANYSMLGIDVVASYIETICRIEGVYDVKATIASTKELTGRNLIVEKWELAKQIGELDNESGLYVSLAGSNNG